MSEWKRVTVTMLVDPLGLSNAGLEKIIRCQEGGSLTAGGCTAEVEKVLRVEVADDE